MNTCATNGQEHEAPEGLRTWGQLLDAFEQGIGSEREVVTAVRFGGVDQPSFREHASQSRAPQVSGPVDVETCQAHALVEEAVEAALNGLAPLANAARQTAEAFRSHDLADAHSRLADLVATLQSLTTLTAAVSQARLTPNPTPSDDGSASLPEWLGPSLDALIAAETDEDWISVADILEYEIADLLPSWEVVLGKIPIPASRAHAVQSETAISRCAS